MSEPQETGKEQMCPTCGSTDLRDKWDRSAYCPECDARRDCGPGAFEEDDGLRADGGPSIEKLLEEMEGPIGPGDAPMVDKPLEASVRKASAQVEIWRAQRAALCVADRALQQVAEDEPEIRADGGTEQPGSEQFEVYAETFASGEIELGTARGIVDACQLIESVDKSKYEPTEYRIRPVEDDDRVAMTDGGTEQTCTDQPTTVEYGVELTLERGSRWIWAGRRMQYWSPEPTSEEEAVEKAREEYTGEIEEIHEVETREVPAPEGWEDDDPRIMTDGGEPGTERCCTRCGKSVGDESYEFWAFRTCRHCAIEADGRFRDGGTYRKWRYFPRWHMTRHPDLPAQHRERHAMTDGGEPQESAAALPVNYESYGTVHDPSPELEPTIDATLEILDEVDRHVCSVEDGKPLCGADADGGAPVYPFRGQRRHIREGLSECCDECCAELEQVAAREEKQLATDGGTDSTDSEQLGELAAEVEEAIRDLRVQTRLLDDTASVADLQDIMWDLQDALPESFEESEDGDDRLITDGGTDSTGTERILDEGERARQVARGDYGDTELDAKIHGPSVTDDEYNESLKLMKVHQGEGSLAGWTKLSLPTDVERVEEFIGVLEDARDELAYLKQAQERPQPGDRDE